MNELELQERDERVRNKLIEKLKDCDAEIVELWGMIAALEKQKIQINTAVDKHRWWDLAGLVNEEDIESLCNDDPDNLLG